MSKKVKVELNSAGMNALLHSKELEAGLGDLAKRYSGGWETDTKQMTGGKRSRVIASIYTTDAKAADEELDTHRIVGGLR